MVLILGFLTQMTDNDSRGSEDGEFKQKYQSRDPNFD